MKRNIFLTSIIFILLIVVSSCGLSPMEEGRSVNEYIFPYVNFTLSEDGSYYTAEIVEGAAVSDVYIASVADYFDDSIPVRYFTGFESDDDIVNLKSTTFESSSTEIKLNSLNQAAVLETIHYKNIDDNHTVWKNLPVLPHTGEYEFIGWYIEGTNKEVNNGDEMKAGETKIYAKRVKVEVVHHEEVPATCTESGIAEYWECKYCGKIFSDSNCTNEISTTIIPALGHALLYVEETEAKCTTSGVKAHYECSRCHELFEDEKAETSTTLEKLNIPALGHNWVRVQDEKSLSCSWDECTRCHETKDPVGHKWDEGVVIKEPTTTEHGTKLFTCVLCKKATKTEDIKPLDSEVHEHDWVDSDYVAPGCTTRGYTVHTCSECGVEYEYKYVDATGHKTTPVEGKAPTCTEDGYRSHYKCTVCSLLFADQNGLNSRSSDYFKIDKLGHLYNEKVYEKGDGYHWHKCTRTGCSATTEKVAHVYDQKTTTYQAKKADCTNPAQYYYTCVCGEKGTETFEYGDPDGHKPEYHEAKAENCGNDGNIEYWECTVCHEKFYDEDCTQKIEDGKEVKPATGLHTFECFESMGEEGHIARCSVCLKPYGTVISHEIDEINWTSNSNGHWHACADCDYQYHFEAHTYKKYGDEEVCEVCLYVKAQKETTTDGGFDIQPEKNEPTGRLTIDGSGCSFTAVFKLDEGAKTTRIEWYLDGVKLEGENGDSCSFSAPERRTYRIMCVLYNGRYINSYDGTVIGGNN